jgi:phosphatidylinositol alpha-mannosyltransferase
MLRSVDVYVAPNTGGESFGIVLLEGMAAGAAVLASDLEAFRLVLDDGSAGVLVPAGDSGALAAEAVRLLQDSGARAALTSAAERVVARYDWERIASRILAVYDTVAVPGEKVVEDSRGQAFGLYRRLKDPT